MAALSESIRALGRCSCPRDVVVYISKLAQNTEDMAWFTTFSPSIYDSAWLSMVYRYADGQLSWLFPECFDYVLSHQLENGVWPSTASTVDGILNTSAALLALLTRRQLVPDARVAPNIESATSGLKDLLEGWNINETDQVGFEVIVPSLLRQISQFGIHFTFPGQARLQALSAGKLAKLHLESLQSERQSTILHSLESLVGIVDFDRLRHHCSEARGVLGSPAASAAYLMHSSSWDDRAETYLRRVVASTNYDTGGIPSAFPTSIFELSWALSTLFMAVDSPTPAETAALLGPVKSYLQETLASQDGVTGFASGILADADDTARVLLTLGLLDVDTDFCPMIAHFRSGAYFKTYELERNPSFSANCNVLLALVESHEAQRHIDTIEAISLYLVEASKGGNMRDKWNSSIRYSAMLFSLAVTRLLRRYGNGDLVGRLQAPLSRDIVICLSQILARTLIDQQEDGSWDSSTEVTAYCALTISQMMRLPFHEDIRNAQMSPALSRARGYLTRHQKDPITPSREDYLWIEKLSYASSLLRKAYIVAAIHASCDQLPCTEALAELFQASPAARKMITLLLSTPLLQQFSPTPFRDLELVLLEARHWSDHLYHAKSLSSVSADNGSGSRKLFDLIPLIFTTCNHRAGLALTPHTLWNMIHLSLLVYQVDEVMESVAIQMSDNELTELHKHLRSSCSLPESLLRRLHPFIEHVLHHPQVQEAPLDIQHELADELRRFLSAHIEHVRANMALKRQRDSAAGGASFGNNSHPVYSKTTSTYYQWVHSIGAADTSCPFASLFFMCLISKCNPTNRHSQSDSYFCFKDAQSQYLSRAAIRHLSAMCRQYNDCGSAARDRAERNLSSLDFLESSMCLSDPYVPYPYSSVNGNGQPRDLDSEPTSLSLPLSTLKEALMEISEFERTCLQLALRRLGAVSISSTNMSTSTRSLDADANAIALRRFGVFVDITDLFGQVYVLQDLTSRIRSNGG
ncbi:hypothetical protein BDV10DRAFT_200525 [Aspergillus recurvatus]